MRIVEPMNTACRVVTGKPEQFTDGQIGAFARMAAANGAEHRGLVPRLKSALALCVLTGENELKGIAGIKPPHRPYHAMVFRSAGVQELEALYPLEYGWMYLAPEVRARGYGEAMLRSCMAAAEGQNLFAIGRSDNGAVARLAARRGIPMLGRPFASHRGRGHQLALFGIENR